MSFAVVNFYPGKPIGFSLKPHSCKVAEVTEFGAASQGGVEPGWCVRSVNDKAVNPRNVEAALTFPIKDSHNLRVQFFVAPKNRNKLLMSLTPSASSIQFPHETENRSNRSSSSSFRLAEISSAIEDSHECKSELSGADIFGDKELISSQTLLNQDDLGTKMGRQARSSMGEVIEADNSSMPTTEDDTDRHKAEPLTPTPKFLDFMGKNLWAQTSAGDSDHLLTDLMKSTATVIYRPTGDDELSACGADSDREVIFKESVGITTTLSKGFDDETFSQAISLGSVSIPYLGLKQTDTSNLSRASFPAPTHETNLSSSEESSSSDDEDDDDAKERNFKYIEKLIRGGPMISRGYTSSMSESKDSQVIVPKGYTNILSKNQQEEENIPGTIQIILQKSDTNKTSDGKEDQVGEEEEDNSESDQDSDEESSQEESGSDEDSAEDDGFSYNANYIESLIRGVPMIPKGLTTSKPKKKSAAVLIPIGYKEHDVEEDLHIGAPSFKVEDKNCSTLQRGSKTQKPYSSAFEGGSSEKPKYLEVPSSTGTYTCVETVVIHRSLSGDSSSYDGDSSNEDGNSRRFSEVHARSRSKSKPRDELSSRLSNNSFIGTGRDRLGSMVLNEEPSTRKLKTESLPAVREPVAPDLDATSESQSLKEELYIFTE